MNPTLEKYIGKQCRGCQQLHGIVEKKLRKNILALNLFFISLFKKKSILSLVNKEDTRLEENASTIIKI